MSKTIWSDFFLQVTCILSEHYPRLLWEAACMILCDCMHALQKQSFSRLLSILNQFWIFRIFLPSGQNPSQTSQDKTLPKFKFLFEFELLSHRWVSCCFWSVGKFCIFLAECHVAHSSLPKAKTVVDSSRLLRMCVFGEGLWLAIDSPIGCFFMFPFGYRSLVGLAKKASSNVRPFLCYLTCK